MSTRLKLSGAAYRRLKVIREENLTKYAGNKDAYVKKAEKIGKVMTTEVSNKQSKQNPLSRMKNKTHFILWVCFRCSRCFIIPHTLNKHQTWSSFISNSCKQIRGVERATLYGRHWATLSLGAPLIVYTNILTYCRLTFELWRRNFSLNQGCNVFAIAGRITFIFMNYGHHSVQDIFTFCLHTLSLASFKTSPWPSFC